MYKKKNTYFNSYNSIQIPGEHKRKKTLSDKKNGQEDDPKLQ